MSKQLRNAPKFRKLTDVEQSEGEIYRRQLRESWSFRPGDHPVDVWRREHDAEEDD